jgi:hypothetical protein
MSQPQISKIRRMKTDECEYGGIGTLRVLQR